MARNIMVLTTESAGKRWERLVRAVRNCFYGSGNAISGEITGCHGDESGRHLPHTIPEGVFIIVFDTKTQLPAEYKDAQILYYRTIWIDDNPTLAFVDGNTSPRRHRS